MKEMYEGDLYAEKNPTWHEEDAPWKAGHIERMIKRNKIPRDRICEIGCGTGEILLTLEKAFPAAALSGYEISPHAFNRAAQKETPHTKFYLKDLLSESDLHFDLVLAIDVIEHVEDYISIIKKLKTFGTYKIFISHWTYLPSLYCDLGQSQNLGVMWVTSIIFLSSPHSRHLKIVDTLLSIIAIRLAVWSCQIRLSRVALCDYLAE